MVLNSFKSVLLKGLFVALFLMPALSYSSTVWEAGTGLSGTGSGIGYGADLDSACQSAVSVSSGVYTSVTSNPSNFACVFVLSPSWSWAYGSTKTVYAHIVTVAVCPVEFEDSGSGQCLEPVSCVLGDILYSDADLVLMTGQPINVGGCEYVPSETITCYYSPGPNETKCNVKFVSSGNTSNLPLVVVGTPTEPSLPADATQDYVEPSSSEVSNSVPVVSTASDGTVTTTEDSVSVTNSGSNKHITESDQFIFIKESNGSTTVIQKNTSTVSNPDGTATIQQDKQIVSSAPIVKTTTILRTDSSSVVTNVGGDTITTNETVINNYYADGTLKDSTTISDGDKPLPPEDEEGNKVFIENTSKGDFSGAVSQVQTEISQAKSDLLSEFNRIKLEASTLINFNVSGSGSLPCPPAVDVAGFGSFSLCLSDYESDLSQIPLILIFIATFLGLALILR